MVSSGIEASRAFWYIVRRVALAVWSPPPSRAATSTWRISFANSFPLALSTAPLRCLVVAHFEWPDIGSVSFDSSQQLGMEASVAAELGMERRHDHVPLAADDGTPLAGRTGEDDFGQHVDAGTD